MAMYLIATLLLLYLLASGSCALEPNGLQCFTCLSPGTTCEPEKTFQYQCPAQETQCVDIQVIGSFGAASDVTLKGCRKFTCSTNLSFSTQKSSVSVHCCDGSLCNDQVLHPHYMESNGVECYTCNTVNGEGCSEEEVTTTRCCGPQTSCIEVTGTFIDDEFMMPVVMKGCATPNACDSDFLPLLQSLDNEYVQCCDGSLCNK